MKILILSIIILFAAVTNVFSQKIISKETLVYNNEEIDFIESYLNLCSLVDSTIDKNAYHKEINILCSEVEKEINGCKSPQELIEKLNNFLFIKKQFTYNAIAEKYLMGSQFEKKEIENDGYNIEEYLLMTAVLKNKEGMCVSLSILYLTIAYKLQLPFFGVIVPHHFFIRYSDDKSKINIETTNFGKQYNDSYYQDNFIKKNQNAIYLTNLNFEQSLGRYLISIGNVFSEENKIDEAIECYNLSLEINPNFDDAYYNRGVTYGEIELFNKAIADYTNAIEINPDFAEAYYNRGVVYGKEGFTDKAIEDYTKAIKISPDYNELYYNRGNMYVKQGFLLKAIQDFSIAIEINPIDAAAYYNRGLAYLEKDYSELAFEDFTKTIEINPNHANAFYIRGVILYNSEKKVGACRDWVQALKLGNSEVQELIDKYCK